MPLNLVLVYFNFSLFFKKAKYLIDRSKKFGYVLICFHRATNADCLIL
jgi:hypothetical protein